MDLLHNLFIGLGVALTFQNLLYALVGCMVGTLIGVLPGIGPVATIAMLLPITFHLPPTAALIMLAGIYYGAQYGGSTTSILVNLPGEASSVVTCLDGYQMARKGRAGAALSISAVGSFFAGTVGTIIIVIFAEPLTRMAQKFGPADYCALMALGLVAAVVLASGSVTKAIAMVFLGLLFERAGLLPALIVLVFISSLGGEEFKLTEVIGNIIALAILCTLVFKVGLGMNISIVQGIW